MKEVYHILGDALFEQWADIYRYSNTLTGNDALTRSTNSEDFINSLNENEEEGEGEEIKQHIKDNPYIAVCGGAPRDWSLGIPARDIDMYILFTREMFKVYRKRLQDKFGGDYESSYLSTIKSFFIMAGLKDKVDFELTSKTKEEEETGYKSKIGIEVVLSLKFKGVEFDLIFVNAAAYIDIFYERNMYVTDATYVPSRGSSSFLLNVDSLTPEEFICFTFDFNICKCYYDQRTGDVVRMFSAEEDFKNKTLSLVKKQGTQLSQSIYKHYPKLVKKFPDFKFNPIIS